MSAPRDLRIEELLVLRATEGLAEAEARELEELLAASPEHDDDAFDLAAAAVDLALREPDPALPAALRERLHRQAIETLGASVVRLADARAARRPAAAWAGWLAAAAALVLGVLGWWPRLAPAPAPVVAPPPTTAQIRQQLLEEDALELPWQATEDEAAAGASGDVVWSASRQTGFMRIRGLAANDPSATQYQLWIFDRDQDERYPVDGGVFDVPAGADEVLVPIDAKIEVDEPYLFAVTVEKPGGVVVSSRERIVLLAGA